MAECTDGKFIISKGLSNEFQLTIKQQGTTLPMIIDVLDTFEAIIYKLDTDTEIARIDMTDGVNGQIVVTDANSGIITLTLKDALTDTLVVDKGSKADDYYLRPTYRIAIDSSTLNNGNFVARLPEVYVE